MEAGAVLILSQELLRGGESEGPGAPGASGEPQAEVPRPAEFVPRMQPGKEQRMAPESDKAARGAGSGASNLDMILDIRLVVRARLGRIEMPINEILALGPGSIVEVGRMLDEPVDLLVNDKLIARGDVVVVDEKFGLRITEIVSTRERIESLR
jgi:flagellar motor switch protein FliN/FliY